MRESDFHSADRRLEGWIVPLERVDEWVRSHPEKMHAASRDDLFRKVWKRLVYLRFWRHGDIIDDETAEAVWLALSLRDLAEAPAFPRFYEEARWEILAELVAGEPPLNGEALYDQQPTDAPILHYQFHGLPAARDAADQLALFDEMLIGQAGAAGILASGDRPAHEDALILSRCVNLIRESRGLPPLLIGEGREHRLLVEQGLFGLLIELEDGSTITPPQAVRA